MKEWITVEEIHSRRAVMEEYRDDTEAFRSALHDLSWEVMCQISIGHPQPQLVATAVRERLTEE